MPHLSRNGDLNLNTSLNIDNNLLDNLSWCIKIDQSLVDSHLECIPGLRTFTAGCLSRGDLKSFGWETDGSLDAEVLRLGALDELLAHFLERGNLAAGEGYADLVSFRSFAELFLGLLVRHGDPSRLEL